MSQLVGKNMLKNAGITFGIQIASLFLKFIIQKAFLETLGVAYLGYNSVFSNILQMLNMADLGVGVAITSFLYKPISENDTERINALMYLYKKIYRYIGMTVGIIGLIILTIIPYIINDAECSDAYLRILFIINLIGVVSTYFLACKRTLIVAQQKSYFTNTVDFLVNVFASILQIVMLFVFSNYIVYLIVTVAKNIISNIIISIFCKKNNRYLKNKTDILLADLYKPPVFLYVKDVFISKIGSYVYYGTDNIIISIFKGSIVTGYLSNYSLVTVALKSLLTEVFSALQATYGNLMVTTESRGGQREITDAYIMLNYIVSNACFICCACIFQPFISLYAGAQYQMNYNTVLLLSANLGLTLLLIIPSQVFVVFKLYKYDKPIVASSAILNIIISVCLVNIIGVDGVLLGTTFTSLIYLFTRYYIISKKAFETSYTHYIKKIVIFFIISIMSYSITNIVTSGVDGYSLVSFILRAISVATLSMLIPVTILSFISDFNLIITRFLKVKGFNIKNVRIFLMVFSVIIIGIIWYFASMSRFSTS